MTEPLPDFDEFIAAPMTKDEFIDRYCAGSNITRADLERCGQVAMPCDCGDESCRGWKMVRTRDGTEGKTSGKRKAESGDE